MKFLSIAIGIILTIFASNAVGEPTRVVAQRSTSAKIQSKDSTINFRTGINTFVGDVLVDHVAFNLTADELVEHRGNPGTERIIAIGAPVKFHQKKPFSERISHGHASKIVFDALSRELHMWNYTVTDLAGTVMSGNKVVYLLLQ